MTRSRTIRTVCPFTRWVTGVLMLLCANLASAECTVTITGGTPVMNVGQLATFTAEVTATESPVSYQWTVSGAILKDYSETTQFNWSTTPMSPGDFQAPSISFYWKSDPNQKHPLNGGPVDRTVRVDVLAGADPCIAQTIVSVERNKTDITRQAEDYYLTNHQELDQGLLRGRALKEHRLWHSANGFSKPGYGTLFFDFHHAYIDRLDSWRQEFGYPTTVPWNTGTPIPTGIEIDHPGRKVYRITPKPTWFTAAGGTGVRSSNGKSCDLGGGQNDLFDFLERAHLGCASASPYHGNIHARVGGIMGNVSVSPQDPLFFRWHLFLDGVSAEWLTGPPVPLAATQQPSFFARLIKSIIPPAIAEPTSRTLDIRAPEVIYQAPFRMFKYITSLPSVSVTFSESVVGVRPSDLTVKGSPATAVSGQDEGPYVFTGYSLPTRSRTQVEIKSGDIRDLSGNSFAGTSWQYRLVKRGADTDGDGIKDGAEARKHLTNPLDPDTDHDGLPDGFEIANFCLDPLMDQTHPHDMNDNHMPGDTDSDDDGITDLEESAQGTNPCDGVPARRASGRAGPPARQ